MPWGIGLALRKLGGNAPRRVAALSFDGTTFPHSLRFTTGRPGGDGPARVNLFGRTSFPHALGSDWPPGKLGGKALRRVAALFLDGTTFPHSLPALVSGEEAMRSGAESPHFFSTEPLFLIPFVSLPAVQEATSVRE